MKLFLEVNRKKKKGRPTITWIQGILKAILTRNLSKYDWQNDRLGEQEPKGGLSYERNVVIIMNKSVQKTRAQRKRCTTRRALSL